ncbi:MAG: YheB [Segetibacter sp.]|nr:YheB [Segetibacter sp.]
MTWTLILIPVISAFIGWFTNWIAIKMLFHPREPTKIFGITFQGIFPKRQQQFAMKLGKLVSSELLSFADIEQKITHPENVTKILPVLETHIDTFLREKLTAEIPMIGMLIGDKTISQVKGVFIKELEELFPILMKQYMTALQHDLDLEKIVIEKVGNFSSNKLEDILNQIMSSEFRFVEIIGAVLGFIIGLLQVFLTIATR